MSLDLKKSELTDSDLAALPDVPSSWWDDAGSVAHAARAKLLLGPDGIVAWLRAESEKTVPSSVRSASCNGLASALAQVAHAEGLEWPMKEKAP